MTTLMQGLADFLRMFADFLKGGTIFRTCYGKTHEDFARWASEVEAALSDMEDAARYKWLREHAIEARDAVERNYGLTADTPVLVMTVISNFDDDFKKFDAAIDSAIEASKQT